MPELQEEMYCSQQICIPPSFPYLLRQYAKAAIRTQPADLLRWSTAYFRCLALNLRPPVKPRLEYPIPKSHFGLTPGWLKALMYQLQNNLTISFKTLWDRWIGACLQHQNLIEVLCLGGFNDPHAIPWFRFVALCAAHLTESLTQTMILVCEIITEEPEGGSAMIPAEVFVDVYNFLAAIDASEPQHLRNLYFTDSLLSLYREPAIVEVKESISEVAIEEEEESVEAEEEKEEVVEEGPVEDLVGVVISCPDIAADDYKTEEDFVLQAESAGSQTSDKVSIKSEKSQKSQVSAKPDAASQKSQVSGTPDAASQKSQVSSPAPDATSQKSHVSGTPDAASQKSQASPAPDAVSGAPDAVSQKSKTSAAPDAVSQKSQVSGAADAVSQKSQISGVPSQKSQVSGAADAVSQKSQVSSAISQKSQISSAVSQKSQVSEVSQMSKVSGVSQKSQVSAKKSVKSATSKHEEEEEKELLVHSAKEQKESVDTLTDYMPSRQRDLELLEDLQKVKAAQEEEVMGEEEEETVDQELEKLKQLLAEPIAAAPESESFVSEESEEKKEEAEEEESTEEKGELIWIDAIPGIGPIVPDQLVEVVIKYMHDCAAIQHGMVMPRNIRHYNCPPLEILQK